MKDISARELKGHNILAVERFKDSTRWMIEFVVLHPCSAYGSRGDEMRLFLAEDSYQNALQDQQRRKIKIKRYARVVEGHRPSWPCSHSSACLACVSSTLTALRRN